MEASANPPGCSEDAWSWGRDWALHLCANQTLEVAALGRKPDRSGNIKDVFPSSKFYEKYQCIASIDIL